MGLLYDFSRLVRKYGSNFKAITITGGFYNDSGDFEKEEKQELNLQGAIISFKESKIYRSEGTLTTKDKRLFTLEPITPHLQGSTVVYEGNVYSVEDNTENAKFTGVYAYTLKYVSAFKETRHEYDATDEINDLEDRLDGILTKEPETVDDFGKDAKDLEKRLDGVLIVN